MSSSHTSSYYQSIFKSSDSCGSASPLRLTTIPFNQALIQDVEAPIDRSGMDLESGLHFAFYWYLSTHTWAGWQIWTRSVITVNFRGLLLARTRKQVVILSLDQLKSYVHYLPTTIQLAHLAGAGGTLRVIIYCAMIFLMILWLIYFLAWVYSESIWVPSTFVLKVDSIWGPSTIPIPLPVSRSSYTSSFEQSTIYK